MDGKSEFEAESSELSDWELLHNSNNNNDNNNNNNNNFHSDEPLQQQLNSDASALIRNDYFSLNPNIPNFNSNSNNNSSSNSSSTDSSEVNRNFDDSYVANQLFPGGEMHLAKDPSLLSSSSSTTSANPQIWNDSDSDSDADKKMMVVADTTVTTTTTTSSELLDGTGGGGGGGGFDLKEEGEEVEQLREEEEKEKKKVMWWKVPFEVFKYWVIRVSPVPVWSLSVAAAAAFLGLVILGRRLYKMKRKTQTLKLNVAFDDKKVSQLMGRVARLNEAFSVVRRVPMVRPSLPASSVTLRPVMSMR